MRSLRAPRAVLALPTLAVAVFLAVLVLAAPAGAQDPAPDDTTVTEAPPETAPEETVPDETVPDETDPDDTDDDGTPTWLLAVVIAVVAVVVLGLAGQLLGSGRRSEERRRRYEEQRRRQEEHALAEQRLEDDRLRRALGGAEWAHDQLTVEILAGGTRSPERLQRSWDESRRRLNELGAEINALALEFEPGVATDLQNLGHVVGLLIGAIDTNVDLRVTAATDPEQVDDALRASTAAVETRRAELAAAITRVRRLL